MKNSTRRIVYGASLAGLAVLAGTAFAVTPAKAPAVKQVVTGPVARYWIDSATNSGMTLGGMGGGKPSLGSMMKMMGGGDNVSRNLYLRLGSSQATQGADALGNHTPPATLGTGPLPLTYSHPTEGRPVEYKRSEDKPADPPKGKILIYWGCGEHAGPNQPLVIDLSKLTDPAQRVALMKQMAPTISLQTVVPPLPSDYKSYGEWPNYKSKSVDIDGGASLAGAHAVKTNFAPDINFTLDQSQDFLPAINVTGNQKTASGATTLTWTQVAGAKALAASVVGGSEGQVVMWTSAMTNTGWMGFLPQYMTPGDIEKLVGNKTLLPGTATTCTVPAEVGNAVQGALYSLVAYGGETNLSYPPRPADPKVAWNIQWETKIRYRSATGGLLGQSMGGMMGRNNDETYEGGHAGDNKSQDNGKKKKSSMFGNIVKQGIGSLIP